MNAISHGNSSVAASILLVDDDPDILTLLAAVARNALGDDARILSVTDPKSARQRLDAEVIDILVTDLQMPGVSGLELLRHARRRNAWTQVIVVTGHSGLDAVTDAMDLGASDYLVKPLDLAQFVESLRELSARLTRWRHSLASTLGHGSATDRHSAAYACGASACTSAASAM